MTIAPNRTLSGFERTAGLLAIDISFESKVAKSMSPMKDGARQALADIRRGHHREAYALFLVGVVLTALGLAGTVSDQALLSVILLALTFLVFHTSVEKTPQANSLDEVLQSREEFGAFSSILPGVRDLRIYGPTGVNVLVSAGDIRRFVLEKGGSVRVIVQAEGPESAKSTAAQLDDNLDFARTLEGSVVTLDRLATHPGFKYRRLPFNPGFSLIIVNATSPDGYVIFESHGFKDESIADRMHIVIKRRESLHWFSYWLDRFETMWDTARPPSS